MGLAFGVGVALGLGLFVLLLTNRVNPTRENRKIAGVRTALADAAVGALRGDAGR